MLQVFEPDISEEDVQAVTDALRRGEVSGTFGSKIEQFESDFAAYSGCKYGISVNSGTIALQFAVAAAGIGAGDEVLVSACTNIASALAAYHNQAIPVAVDSEPDTWNLNLDLIEGLITPKTKAILPVHIYGHPVDMDRLMEIARKHNLIVIEDCAEAHGAQVRGKPVGGFGHASCYSFYANKIITTGEGGMVVTNDPDIAAKVKLYRNLAFEKPRFFHNVAGFSARMTGIQAALGASQFARIDAVIERKRQIAAQYSARLAGVAGIELPQEAAWAKNVYWMYGIVLSERFPVSRDRLCAELAARGIDSRTFFCPMNLQPCLQSQPGARTTSCPVAERLWERGLYLPSSNTLTAQQIESVCSAIEEIAGKR